MSFDTLTYALFLAVAVAVYWRLDRPAQNRLLLVASYVFYGSWDWRFLSLILFSTVTDYALARAIDRATDKRRLLLVFSIVINLGVLAVFKYFDFFLTGFVRLAELAGFQPSLPTVSIILPVGISFYTFQSMSYVIDVYRRKLRPSTSLAEFALFISFFPQLVAGPILRAKQLLTQLREPRMFRRRWFRHGLDLIVWGLIKKIIVADNVGYYVNQVFGLSSPSTLLAALATLGFGIQIYCDFSGYIDIGRGSANLLGMRLPRNFRRPYAATSITDFWRRWHITLSTWIRDYLYIPLGGSRCSPTRNAFNILVTWALCGLWHGAAMRFILWGLYHGILILVERRFPARGSRTAGIVRTFALVSFGWMIFRTPAVALIPRYFSIDALVMSHADLTVAAAMVSACAFYCLPLLVMAAWSRIGAGTALPAAAAVRVRRPLYVLSALLIMIFAKIHSSDFIYFQF